MKSPSLWIKVFFAIIAICAFTATFAEWTTAKNYTTAFVQATSDTPVFYTGALKSIFGGTSGTGLSLDEYGQIDPLEFVAFSGTVFSVEKTLFLEGNMIYQVKTDIYPYENGKGFFIDSRFVQPTSLTGSVHQKLPPQLEILANLRTMIGLPYIWGGNSPNGIGRMLEYYTPRGIADESLRSKWLLKGVDCSGLLYSATRGNTPRNTSDLVNFGSGVTISGLSVSKILAKMRPLDLIAWSWHVMIYMGNGKIIESRASFDENGATGFSGGGVRTRNAKEVLQELLTKRIAVDSWSQNVPDGKKKFVIRRWYTGSK